MDYEKVVFYRDRPQKRGISLPARVRFREQLLKQWENPEYREKMSKHRRDRRGVPNGMTRAEAVEAWAVARAKTEVIFNRMVDAGMAHPLTDDDFETVVMVDQKTGDRHEVKVPKTDEGKASLALKESVLAMLSPMNNQQEKHLARRTVLEFTKSKPTQKIEAKLSHEDLLEQIVADAKNGK